MRTVYFFLRSLLTLKQIFGAWVFGLILGVASLFLFAQLAHADYTIDLYNGETATGATIGAGEQQRLAQQITTVGEAYIDSIDVCMLASGSPTGDVFVSVQADSGGEPSGTSLVQQSMAASGITTAAQYGFTFDSPVLLAASTDYWVVITRSETSSGIQSCGVTTGGTGYMYYNGSWNTLADYGISLIAYLTDAPPTPPVASTTLSVINNPTLDMFLGIVLFFMVFVFVIWFFRRPYDTY